MSFEKYPLLIISFLAGALVAGFIATRRKIGTIIDHTLKNPKTNQWSRKSITGMVAMVYSMYYCQDCLLRNIPINEAIVLIYTGVATACLGLSSWEKANVKKSDEPAD